jgi:hypothetical protein
MVRGRIRFAGVSVAVVAAGTLTAGIVAAAPAGAAAICGSGGDDCYTLTVSPPQSVTAGASQQSFSFIVTDQASGHDTDPLASAQVTAPAGYVVTSASASAGTQTLNAAAGTVTFNGLGLHKSGASATLTVVATAPCSGAGSAWTVQPGESSPFFGTNGDNDNDYAHDFQASTASFTVTGSCTLAFQNGTAAAGPVTTQLGSPITSVVGSPASTDPVTVEVLDGNGNVITSSTAPITITATQNSSALTPPVTTELAATGGVASFSDILINQTGAGFQLTASTTSTGIAPVTSSYFEILNDVQGCKAGACTGTTSTSTTTGTVTTSSATSGQFLGVGLGGVTFACGGSYKPVSDPLSFDVLTSSGTTTNAQFTVTLSVSWKVAWASGHPAFWTWQVCFGSNVPFTALPGTASTATIGGVTYYTGLLPTCQRDDHDSDDVAPTPPCVLDRRIDWTGNVIVTFLGVGDAYGKM